MSVAAFAIVEYREYRSMVARSVDLLAHKSTIVSRRLSAELMLGKDGAIEAVSKQLATDLKLLSVGISAKPSCIETSKDSCARVFDGAVHYYQRAPGLESKIFSDITVNAPSYFESMDLHLLLWSGLPIFLTLAVGILIQRIYLRKYILKPIQSLVHTTANRSEPSPEWPIEIKDISNRLSQSFEKQEQAVFGQLARGVVHDVKTLLHSVMSAMELVNEVTEESEKRKSRLEMLQKTSTINLPKMKKIIELTLDGSREIPVRPVLGNLNATIRSSIESNRHLALSRKVNVVFDSSVSDLMVSHDAIQLERAFTNLIKNGIEAFESRSDQSPIVQIKTVIESGQVKVQIEDSGPGLKTPSDQIFKPLRSTKSHGSGLGLFVSKKIIESHRGQLLAGSSDTLKGAKFTVTLLTDREAGT
ncbi:MAG: HAMP domain-containing histidine kinase [Xanthomonadaceae bacterium]|nr:HAMP domain-containing histidine kinase [Xanthomonadaceae bacterium]